MGGDDVGVTPNYDTYGLFRASHSHNPGIKEITPQQLRFLLPQRLLPDQPKTLCQ